MARPLRVEYAGAIYHAYTRGSGCQRIFHDDGDYERMLDGLESTVGRFDWELFSFVLMPNHLHLFFQTHLPNLSLGMQCLLSGYANWYVKRHQVPGHVFQGRFKDQLVEDESYFWTVSRYIHLNPCRGKQPLVRHPRQWSWSSYPGYEDPNRRFPWVSSDRLLSSWQGELGGGNPALAYQSYVEAGLEKPPANPFADAEHGWILGSETFVDRIRSWATNRAATDTRPPLRQLRGIELSRILHAVADRFETSVESFAVAHSRAVSRPIAAYLSRRWTGHTLRELAPWFGIDQPQSVRNLVQRAESLIEAEAALRSFVEQIEWSLVGEGTDDRS